MKGDDARLHRQVRRVRPREEDAVQQRVVRLEQEDERVIVHVDMKNTSVEHVTAYIYPKYRIAGGGVHGAGFSSIESKGFDAGEFRSLRFSEDPEGVKPLSPIAKCMPELQMVKSG